MTFRPPMADRAVVYNDLDSLSPPGVTELQWQ